MDTTDHNIVRQLIIGEIDDAEAKRLMIEWLNKDFEYDEQETNLLYRGLLSGYWKDVISEAIKWYSSNARGAMYWDDIADVGAIGNQD